MSNLNLPLIESLIKLKTIPECPADIATSLQLVEDALNGFTVEYFERIGVRSLLVYCAQNRPERFGLLLNGHLDVIPGNDTQYNPRTEGDRLYGVGAMDMKGNLVAAIEAFKSTARSVSYPVGLQIVTDEETGGFDGTKYQIESGVRADFVLSTEPTNFDIVNEAKGVILLEINATGETAHGAYPWRGKNAALLIAEIARKINNEFPIPAEESWVTTCNIAGIDTPNQAYNKVPNSCRLRLDIRTIPTEHRTVMNRIQSLLPETCSVTVIADEPALATRSDNVFATKLAEITSVVIGKPTVFRGAQGSSDARHYQLIHTEGVEFGPIGEGIGSDNEWVSVSSLANYKSILERFIRALDSR